MQQGAMGNNPYSGLPKQNHPSAALTATPSCSSYDASGIPEMNPVKTMGQGRAPRSIQQECRKVLLQMALSGGTHKVELPSSKWSSKVLA